MLRRNVLWLLTVLSAGAVSAQVVDVSGTLADASGAAGKGSSSVRVVIESFTSEEHRTILAKELGENIARFGRALSHIEKGYIQFGGDIGYPLAYAQEERSGSGRVIRVVTDRPFPIFAVYRSLRDFNHPFGVLELTLDSKGGGEGRLIPAASVKMTDGKLEIDAEATSDFALLKLKPTKR